MNLVWMWAAMKVLHLEVCLVVLWVCVMDDSKVVTLGHILVDLLAVRKVWRLVVETAAQWVDGWDVILVVKKAWMTAGDLVCDLAIWLVSKMAVNLVDNLAV